MEPLSFYPPELPKEIPVSPKKTKRPDDVIDPNESPSKFARLSKETELVPETMEISPKKTKRSDNAIDPNESPSKLPRSSNEHTSLSPAFKNLYRESVVNPAIKKQLVSLFDEESTDAPTKYESNKVFLSLVDNCKEVLKNSTNESIPLSSRLQMLPKRIGDSCASGSYVASSTDVESAIIVKPANQEPGAKGCPTGTLAKKAGVNPGESALRERLAWKAQDLLNVDLGIPPVYLTTMDHPFFGNIKEIQECLSELKKKNVTLSIKDLFELASIGQDINIFIENLLEKTRAPNFQEIRQAGLPENQEEGFVKFCLENDKLMMSLFFKKLAEAFENAEWITKGRGKIIQFWGLVGKQKGAEELIQKAYALYSAQASSPTETLASVQKFEQNDGSLEDLPESEYHKIPVEEFHKLAIDVILFNMDRHLGNILLKKEHTSPTNYVYRFILIDHGYCLPRPMYQEDCDGIKEAQFDFLTFKQAGHPITGAIREAILALDIDSFIENLRLDVTTQQQKHPNFLDLCFVPEECFSLIDFNLRVLKKGVEMNRSLKEIASLLTYPDVDNPRQHFGGEMVNLFKKTITPGDHDNLILNRDLFEDLLEKIFTSERLHQPREIR